MNEQRPTFRDRMKPVEYIGFAAIAAIFTGLVVLLVSKSWLLVAVFSLVAFVACLITLATLLLMINKDIDKTKLEAAKREEDEDE